MKKLRLVSVIVLVTFLLFFFKFEEEKSEVSLLSGSGQLFENGAYLELEATGNQDFGIVINIKVPNEAVQNNLDYDKALARYQALVLDYLINERFKHVFVENLHRDYTSEDILHDPMKLSVRDIFRDWSAETTNETQNNLLLGMGAARIFAFLSEDVTIHKARDIANCKKFGTKKDESGLISPEVYMLDSETLDRCVAKTINSFLLKNPGSKIALISSYDNSLRKYFSDKNSPSLYALSFEAELEKIRNIDLEKH